MSIPQTPQGGSGRFYPQCSASYLILIKALGETASCTTLLSHVILSKNSFLAAHSPVPGESECKGTAFPETCKLFGRLFCRNHALFTFLDMSQGGTTAGQDRAGSAVYGTRGKGTEGQKNKGKEENGKEDRRTEEQKKDKREGNLQLPSLFDATNFVTVLYGDFCLLY